MYQESNPQCTETVPNILLTAWNQSYPTVDEGHRLCPLNVISWFQACKRFTRRTNIRMGRFSLKWFHHLAWTTNQDRRDRLIQSFGPKIHQLLADVHKLTSLCSFHFYEIMIPSRRENKSSMLWSYNEIREINFHE